MKRLILIIALLFAVGTFTDAVAQGRKREHKNQRRSGGGGKRKGHSFSGKKSGGVFSGLFSGKKRIAGGWVYKPTRPGKKQNREQSHLFTRYRTKNKKYKDGIQARLNRERARKRSRGNATFHRRKY